MQPLLRTLCRRNIFNSNSGATANGPVLSGDGRTAIPKRIIPLSQSRNLVRLSEKLSFAQETNAGKTKDDSASRPASSGSDAQAAAASDASAATDTAVNVDDTKANLSFGSSQREVRSAWAAEEVTKEWVSRFTTHLKPGTNWIREQVFNRLLRYAEAMERRFENLTPATYRKYKSLSGGFTLLVKDMIKVTEMATELHYQPRFHLYKRRELEAYLDLPKDIKKVLPLLIIFPLPGGALICLPLASYFPRHFLSRHFWSEEQRVEFSEMAHKRRISYYRTLLGKLKRCALRRMPDGVDRDYVIALVEKVEHGGVPTLEELRRVESCFQSDPLDLEYFSRSHKRALLRANNIRWVLLYQRNLYIEGQMLRAIDDVTRMEGVVNLTDSELSWILFARGFNPAGLSRDDQLEHLEEWLRVTTRLDPRSIALYLHLPALLFYNNKNTQKEIEHVHIPDDE